MPRGRFLSRDVSTSERLANLRSDFARLLWTWCIPHADCDGRLPGSSRVLRAAVVPMLDVSNEDVSEAVADLVRCRLAVLYDSGGTRALQILKFADHQTGMRPDREAPSKYGPPPDLLRTSSGPTPDNSGPCSTTENDSTPEDSGPTPEDSREGPPKLSEVKVSSSEAKVSQVKANVRRVFEAWKLDTGHERSQLDDKRGRRIKDRLSDGFTPDDLIEAITGRHNDPWLMGTDPKSSGKVFDGISTLFRDREKVEELQRLARDGPPVGNTVVQRSMARAAKLEAEGR